MQVWGPACSAAGAEDAAAAIRRLLPAAVPARLLLPALASHLPKALVRIPSAFAPLVSIFCDFVFLSSLLMCQRTRCTLTRLHLIYNVTLRERIVQILMQRTGARSTSELLEIAVALLSLQKPSAAIVQAEAAFRFLLPSLDARQTRLAQFESEGKVPSRQQPLCRLQSTGHLAFNYTVLHMSNDASNDGYFAMF